MKRSVGLSIAVLVATFVLGLGAFWFLVQQQVPGYGWLLLIGTGVLIWYEQRSLPGLKERAALRAARAEALRLVKAVRISAKKQKSWTGTGVKEQLEKLCDEAAASVTNNADVAAVLAATERLDQLADKALLRKSAGREYFEQIGGALLAAGILRAFFYEAFRIPSGSMVPTLLVGDHLFVNKFVYGIRVPFSLTKFFVRVPERGDIVVFNRPPDGTGDDIIKRVIGLPGDRVEVRDRHVTINGKPFETKKQLNFDLDDCDVTGEERGSHCTPGRRVAYVPFEEKVGTHTHIAVEQPGQWPTDGTWMVEPDHVFVMGDNRDNSLDSRFGPEDHGFGQVPLNFIKGRADVIWLSLGGTYGIRFARMFSLVH
jgi:signal peptidase I